MSEVKVIVSRSALAMAINALRRDAKEGRHVRGEIADELEKTCELSGDYSALLARHNALKEAVAWERECCQDIRPLTAWADLYVRHGEDYVDAVAEALREIQDAARAEVDRLIANEGAADCKGEG